MLKHLVMVGTMALVGCAGRPATPTYQPADLTTFVANCRVAKSQIDFLQKEIDDYLAYHRTQPVTLEDQRYYGKLKNNIWSLRSTCAQKYL
jgi:uncharacterized lipoprotein YmbA